MNYIPLKVKNVSCQKILELLLKSFKTKQKGG